MKKLSINTISGLYGQFFRPDHSLLVGDNQCSEHYLDINAMFWKHILELSTIERVITKLSEQDDSSLKMQFVVVKKSPDEFVGALLHATSAMCDLAISEQALFSYIETVNIYCDLYSFLFTLPFHLRIDEGFVRSNDSSKEMYEHCLLPYSNPYLSFIENYVIKEIIDRQPEILWMEGRPNVASFAIARLLRKQLPDIYIAVSKHSSEYYSINKLDKYIQKNEYLFRCFDVIALADNSNQLERQIEDYIVSKKPLSSINNIAYINRDLHKIQITKRCPQYSEGAISFRSHDMQESYGISPSELVDVKLFPNSCCYWNRCTFCGINSKYSITSSQWDIQQALSVLEGLHETKIKYFWSIDEAVPIDTLECLAQEMINRKYDFIWHTRSRIEIGWGSPDLAKILAKAGLKQIRLGFESATRRVLDLMDKHDNPSEIIDYVPQIVNNLTSHGIKVHFPSIIGFPTETAKERNNTLVYLNRLHEQYPLFTYNVNILELDISSKLFSRWTEYDISDVRVPYPMSVFLGNTVVWSEPITDANSEQIQADRTTYMRKQYSWYPVTAVTEPHIFYRLCEAGRHTMFSQPQTANRQLNIGEIVVRSTRLVTLDNQPDGKRLIYSLETHRTLVCDQELCDFISANDSIQIDVMEKDKLHFLEQLVCHGFYNLERG